MQPERACRPLYEVYLGYMKPYVPDILGYKPFYIQTEDDSFAVDTAAAWGLVAKSNPAPMLPSPKEPYKNDFKDENGDDEYCGNIFYEAFTFTVQFYVKAFADPVTNTTAEAVLNDQVRRFFEKIASGEFRVFDSYTGIGYKSVRYAGCDNDSIEYKARDNWATMIIEIEFKVNDPVTRMRLVAGKLIAAPDITLETDKNGGVSISYNSDKVNIVGGSIDEITGIVSLELEV